MCSTMSNLLGLTPKILIVLDRQAHSDSRFSPNNKACTRCNILTYNRSMLQSCSGPRESGLPKNRMQVKECNLCRRNSKPKKVSESGSQLSECWFNSWKNRKIKNKKLIQFSIRVFVDIFLDRTKICRLLEFASLHTGHLCALSFALFLSLVAVKVFENANGTELTERQKDCQTIWALGLGAVELWPVGARRTRLLHASSEIKVRTSFN